MVIASSLTGCRTDGGSADAAASGGGGGGGSAKGGAGGGAVGGGGGHLGNGGAGGQVVDCFPACVADLRRDCERPRVDAGTCTSEVGLKCYSNGVHEISQSVDGGSLVVFTQPDGTTPCYRVLVDSAGEHFQNLAGQDVALVTSGSTAGAFVVTCNGTTVNVNIDDPSCATLNEGSCASGTSCP